MKGAKNENSWHNTTEQNKKYISNHILSLKNSMSDCTQNEQWNIKAPMFQIFENCYLYAYLFSLLQMSYHYCLNLYKNIKQLP